MGSEYCINCMRTVPVADHEMFEARHEALCPKHPEGGHSACQCGDRKPAHFTGDKAATRG